MQITDKSWKDWYEDWRQSMNQIETPAQSMDRLATTAHKYLRKIGRGTPKAQFFCTSDSNGSERGFWCPRSVIVSDTGSVVHVEQWCKLTIIEYNR